MFEKLKNFFKAPEPIGPAATQTAILGASTQPLVVNPDAAAKVKQMLYRKDAIERYVTQQKQAGRIISDEKMRELNDDYAILCIELRRAGEIK